MSEEGSEKPIIQQPEPATLGRRTFIRRAGIAAAGVGAALLGLSRLNQTQEPSNISEDSKPGGTSSLTPEPEQTNPSEEENINKVDFPYESKNTLTQEEFFEQFDRMYSEGQKAPDKSWKPDVVYYTSTGEIVFLGKRTRPYPKTGMGDPTPTTEINMIQIAVKKRLYFEHPNYARRELFRYPGDSEILQYVYELYEGHESEKSTEYLEWASDLSPIQKTKYQPVMSEKEMHRLSKTLTDEFNWAVANNAFFNEPPPQPRPSFQGETKV